MTLSRGAMVGCALCLLAFALVSAGAGPARSPQDMALRSLANGPTSEPVARGPVDNAVVLQVDDGSYEAALGVISTDFTVGSQAYFLNRFTIPAEQLPFTIDSLSILFPLTARGTTTGLHGGEQFDVLIFDGPSGTGDALGTTLRARKSFAVQPSNTVFQVIQLDLPVVIQSGDVWVGFTNTSTRIDNRPILPAAADQNGPQAGRSWAFFNTRVGSHFDGPLETAEVGEPVDGVNWLIRANGQAGGLTCVQWDAPGSLRGDDNPPPVNTHVCDDVPEPRDPALLAPRGTLMGYNVYRSNQSGVQPGPSTFFTSTPPTQTNTGSSVDPGGSFFVITAVYDTGESGPSNEVAIVPPTITKLNVKTAKITAKGTGFTTDLVQVFVDGIPFLNQARVKASGTKVVQTGTLITGDTIGAYLAAHGNTARIDFRNSTGAIRALQHTR